MQGIKLNRMSSLFIKSSSLYFWYYAILGLIVPFLAVYLDYLQFSSLQIGEILAIFTATKVVGPTIWALLADKSGKQLPIIRLGALLSLVFFTCLLFVDAYWPVTFSLALFSLFWTAILPQMEVMTLTAVRRSAKIYARIRLWGSIGFIAAAVIGGEAISQFSPEIFTYFGLAILALLYWSTLMLKQPYMASSKLVAQSPIMAKFLQLSFVIFFVAGLLLQISFGPYNGFFALFLRDLNYPGYAVGLFIGIGVVAEIIIFIYAGKLFRYFSVSSLLIFSIFITAIRWFLVAVYGANGWILALTQVSHAAGYGIYHNASMQFIHQHFDANQQNRGQAVYIAGVYGIGGALGAYITGVLWLDGTGAQNAFNVAGIAALVGALSMLLMVKPKKDCCQ